MLGGELINIFGLGKPLEFLPWIKKNLSYWSIFVKDITKMMFIYSTSNCEIFLSSKVCIFLSTFEFVNYNEFR